MQSRSLHLRKRAINKGRKEKRTSGLFWMAFLCGLAPLREFFLFKLKDLTENQMRVCKVLYFNGGGTFYEDLLSSTEQ